MPEIQLKQDEVLDKSEPIISQLPAELRKKVGYWDVFSAAIDIAGPTLIKVRLEREQQKQQ